MNILVTGGTGLVGRRLIEKLAGRHALAVVSRSEEKAAFAQGLGVKVSLGDISDKDFVCGVSRGIECIVHLAATFTPGKAAENNLIFMRNIILAATLNGIDKLVFMSSINSKFVRQGPYSLSKRLCEEELMRSRLDYVILRPTLIYDDCGGVFISQLLRFAKKFHIAPIIGNGEYRIQPIHVDDVVSVIEKVLSSHKKKAYDLAGPEVITYNKLVDLICESLNGKKVFRLHLPVFFLRYFGPFIGIGQDKVLELNEDRTADPGILREEFALPLVDIKSRLGLMLRNAN